MRSRVTLAVVRRVFSSFHDFRAARISGTFAIDCSMCRARISALISGIIVFFGGLLVVKTVHIIADLTESQAIVAPAMEAQPSKKK